MRPDTARRVHDDGSVEGDEGVEGDEKVEEVAVDELEVGDRVRIKPGEDVPVDGAVVEGDSTVDESVATGESIPEEKTPGDELVGGSVNRTGTLLVEVTATGDDAFLNRVAREIEQARATKPGLVKLADRILQYFVPGVLTIAALSFLFWAVVPAIWPEVPALWSGELFGTGPNVQRGAFAALAVLVLGYPCALGMATPLALIRGGAIAASRGVLMRSGDAFQIFRNVTTVVLDKTGTITAGEPTVREVVALNGRDEDDVLEVAATAEAFSEHPLADAILDHAGRRGVEYADPADFESVTGNGVRATVDDERVSVGKPGWLADEGVAVGNRAEEIQQLQHRGLTVSGVAVSGELVGLVGIGDEVKDDAAETIRRMEDAGIEPVVITGDNERTARAVADEVGIDPRNVRAEVLPEDKREEIRQLQADGERVVMVGDGINDAPALTQADVGIAIGAGTDIAIESADVVLMGDRLGGVMDAYEIGANSYRKTRQNLATAFAFNGIGVAAATTGLVHPVFAMIAMVLSVSAVLLNSFGAQLLKGERPTVDFEVAETGERTA
jgi:heavy metal translocating P-type ATPase